jgi:eukaryotic-like serine/threonine-protein kinase
MTATFRLRGYSVERMLGRGGSGEVWQARVTSSGAPVALKRIPVADESARERAHTEAALLSALDHPNLVRLHAVIPSGDAVVLVLDLAEGGSLADLLAARGRLTPGEVITAVAPVAAGLAYLHEHGVVHGDVSAANILFTAAGVPLLADVGVARLTGDDADAQATPAYVDPAVAAGCIPGPPSDVFMLGGVALHALTGTPPWPAEDGPAALELAAGGRLDDVAGRLAAAGCEPAMSAVLERALTVDPHRRGTAADLALDLRYSGEPAAVELAAGRARPRCEPPARSGPRHLAASGAAAPAAAPAPAPADRSRPAFDRPTSGPVARSAPPPTRMAAARPRPLIPRPPQRRRLVRGPRAVIAGVAAAAVVGGGAALALVAFGRDPHPAPAGTPVRVAEASTPSPSARATAGGPDWPAQLASLDAVRAAAFATRDPALLRRVYLPGRLLETDVALLNQLVPAGCGLAGAHTSYTGVHAEVRGDRVVVSVTATLRPSQLVCGGRTRATAAGAGPTRLQLVLERTSAGVRIGDQRLVSSP